MPELGLIVRVYRLSNFFKSACVILVLSMVMFLVGMSTPYWVTIGLQKSSGLWQHCGSDSDCEILHNPPKPLHACQALEIISLLMYMGLIILALLYMLHSAFEKSTVILATIVLSFTSAFTMLVGVIIYGTKVKEDLAGTGVAWSLWLVVISALMNIAVGTLFVLHKKARTC
ncbi:uncharacterized protein LOC106176435 [Lingula anatina]|uniref:Uncharacterized protein LOC106176435 n=1 Tax=Lingula anatina TaxID=7574 RepID=A0A1S3JW30_LINAN|nr:uncharacterized protein LOC106176435 [Lingula anatina]|eukprot:XP_013414266.1 uncharacterized protein LOC106176435 [Lingula anatina]